MSLHCARVAALFRALQLLGGHLAMAPCATVLWALDAIVMLNATSRTALVRHFRQVVSVTPAQSLHRIQKKISASSSAFFASAFIANCLLGPLEIPLVHDVFVLVRLHILDERDGALDEIDAVAVETADGPERDGL